MSEVKSQLNKFPLRGVPIFGTGKEFIGGELTGLRGKLIAE